MTSSIVLHRCAFCPAKQVAPSKDLPLGWALLGGSVACQQCVTLARALATTGAA